MDEIIIDVSNMVEENIKLFLDSLRSIGIEGFTYMSDISIIFGDIYEDTEHSLQALCASYEINIQKVNVKGV